MKLLVVGSVWVGVDLYVMRCASDRGSFEVLERGESSGERCRDPPPPPDMRLLARPSWGNNELWGGEIVRLVLPVATSPVSTARQLRYYN